MPLGGNSGQHELDALDQVVLREGADEEMIHPAWRARSSELYRRDRGLMTAHLLDQRGPGDIGAGQLRDDSVERHGAAQQESVPGMGGRLDAEALTPQDPGHDGAEIRIGVHEENPPSITGGARRELVSH